MTDMVHVVLVYQREAGRLLLEEPYDDLHTAMRRRFALERTSEYDDMEIVVLSADSTETLRETHGRYFLSSAELIQRFRDVVAAA
ncbi:hypothetical protein F0L68_08535 [Solihabitans fulvus]|uniref:Uncharacterized protein n=1 Tax=Solihabitans fulvus TaxID=1892852 RepID=A0A5B2XM85_9PSEU|nr:hypothetical protein [Solihabitans fulvus]KAA2264029.1 hypothetical protein F0L68_08535 [Solihabitans fulvus]